MTSGVSVTQTFDRLGRLLTRAVPGQGTEVFQSSALGLTNHTGPGSKVTRYVYDAAGRKTGETTPRARRSDTSTIVPGNCSP